MTALFPAAWFAAGVVDEQSARDFEKLAQAAPQRPLRAWRWAAFRDWCEERDHLTPEQCRALYQLGEAEPDTNLGTAIMCRAVLDRACPHDIRAAARETARHGLLRNLRLVKF
jgi:hypothetical protein